MADTERAFITFERDETGISVDTKGFTKPEVLGILMMHFTKLLQVQLEIDRIVAVGEKLHQGEEKVEPVAKE